jgi:hypothetical protein
VLTQRCRAFCLIGDPEGVQLFWTSSFGVEGSVRNSNTLGGRYGTGTTLETIYA